jgi:signal transduction histidine kinase
MRERIQKWGGEMEIKGMTDKETTITARMPVGKVKE